MTCFTGTKVLALLVPKCMYCRASCCAGSTFGRGPDTLCDPNKQLYWYKNTNTDASCCAGATFVRGPDTLCDPNKQPSVCIYTSSGTERAAVPDCQIERCCPTCTSDEDANAQGYGAVCAGSTAGLKREKKPLKTKIKAACYMLYAICVSSSCNTGRAGMAACYLCVLVPADAADVLPQLGTHFSAVTTAGAAAAFSPAASPPSVCTQATQ